MDNSIYVGLSRQMMLRRELDVIANNIANADTSGFKVEDTLTKTEAKAAPRTPAAVAWARASRAWAPARVGELPIASLMRLSSCGSL